MRKTGPQDPFFSFDHKASRARRAAQDAGKASPLHIIYPQGYAATLTQSSRIEYL